MVSVDPGLLEEVRHHLREGESTESFVEDALRRRLDDAGEPAESEYLRGLQAITAALANAADLDEICQVVLSSTGVGLGGEQAIWRLEGGRLSLVAGGEVSRRYPEIPLDDRFPARENLESGEPLFVESREEILKRWPALEGAPTAAFAALPLLAEGRRLGLLAIGHTEDHRFSPAERDYLRAVAEQTAVAIERAELRQARLESQRRRELLAEAMFEMSAPHSSPVALLERLATLAVPRFCDWCMVFVRRAGRFQLAASARDATIGEDAEEYARSRPIRELLLAAGIHEGEAVVISAEAAGATPGADALLEHFGLSSLISVPLQWGEGVGGLMLFGAGRYRTVFRNADLGLAASLAQRATISLEHQRIEQENRDFAETLTRAILPGKFPDLERVAFGACFEPAGEGSVGGDWYDVFEWGSGRYAMVVGDVSGHGVAAAAAMARLRNGLFAFASEGHSPVNSVARLAPLLAAPDAEGDGDLIATVKLAIIDPETATLEVANAGHPPMLVLRDGVVSYGPGGGTALSTAFEPHIAEYSMTLETGQLTLFFTDGLVERPGEEFDTGLERLAAALAPLEQLDDLDRLCRRLVRATAPSSPRRDDCCVVAMRVLKGR